MIHGHRRWCFLWRPGSVVSSLTAITTSWDQQCIKYAAVVKAYGFRVEIIITENIEKIFNPLV